MQYNTLLLNGSSLHTSTLGLEVRLVIIFFQLVLMAVLQRCNWWFRCLRTWRCQVTSGCRRSRTSHTATQLRILQDRNSQDFVLFV